MSGERRIIASWVEYLILILLVFVGHFPHHVWSQDAPGARNPKPRLSPLLSNIFLGRFNRTVEKYEPAIEREIGFCTENVKKDFNGAFDFSGREEFFQNCQDKLHDLPIRLCTVSELRVYFTSFLKKAGDTKKSISQSHFLEPTKNCNLSSWTAGCEAGWASAANPGQQYDFNETDPQKMPFRTTNSKPCCEGFFCPQGLTCMIPCPLGAHCPVAKLNPTTGICLPYHYQQPADKLNHSCGAADMWVPVQLGKEIFCEAGYYCPTTIEKIQCPGRCYCRMGSRVKYRCFIGTKCEKGTEIPSMKVYGILLIALLTAILIVVYNCSDQVISTRYEKQAKSREAAAKYARESVQASQKSKAAKDLAGWKPSGLQGLQDTLSRKFSRTKTKSSLPPAGPSASQGNRKTEIASKRLHDDNPESGNGSNLENKDNNTKHQRKTSKELHTRSQIFKYAYGQIEREKAMEEMNMSSPGGFPMMYGDGDVLRRRPRIEIAFKELTLTLKGKNKTIMRSVSGKIFPGRISAVMGPSGAGKTTFLSALTGKLSGCTMSGMILINGKNESIHSYKKIVGFVPQDDIVHGDLTVEENLRFSARCRLSADMPKADKVLITERVIEALGLQGVRDSKVGTVEKRGISGGQKKRVNVGLEMVMEPSLLILDEPTSGLDSASSSLLLRALRREALAGVNISMVVHQPSYFLYKMFDDLILLAKGGLTVYHGPIEKVEEYFEGLGITIPDRVNTPDHLIDILEGIIKPGGDVTAQQLPVRWMLHNGYRVPPDMLHLCEQSVSSSALPGLANVKAEGQRETERYNYFTTPDLSGRVTPGVFKQYKYYLGRVAKQRMRDARAQAADYLILLLAGACLGTMAEVSDVSFGYTGYQYTVIAVSLLCMIGALRTFSQDKLQYKRESASGMNSLSYFLAKDTMDLLNVVLKPLVYLCIFYFFSYPRSSFESNYVILLCLVYCVTGISYTLAISLEFSQAQLWSVLLPVVLTLIANQEKKSVAFVVARFVFPRWALEAFVIANAKEYKGVWLLTRCAALQQFNYDIHNSKKCLGFLAATGFGCRLIAFMCLFIRTK
ncbi:putative white-brown complex homolog protein 30 [Cynara cardunculus var. scolymus]|uniref:putative white-brown complex homolog protein 30 n=1 Tax=Cynara cardunculus var. scolymus TaxID=59895 RepID=UPI000D62988E|nr:putative white-brown complex homolog protein 30 [Cynara cardunculus var. scolymus]